jgi:hypothetical protein
MGAWSLGIAAHANINVGNRKQNYLVREIGRKYQSANLLKQLMLKHIDRTRKNQATRIR